MTLPAIIRLRTYRHYAPTVAGGPIRLNWFEMKAPEGKVFVAVVLGTENKDGSDPMPLLAMLRDLVIDGEPVVPAVEVAS